MRWLGAFLAGLQPVLGSAQALLRGSKRLVPALVRPAWLQEGIQLYIYELCSASLLQSQNNRSWPILLTGADGGSMFEVPFAVLATIDRKAQKESFLFGWGFCCWKLAWKLCYYWYYLDSRKSSLSYWPCWGTIPDVFLYTAVKQEVEPKPKIDLNHCFVKNQNWTWIIVFFWLHWIQIIIGHSWIQPQLKPTWKKHRLWPWIGETEGQESASCNECGWCYLYANSNFILLCMCAYVCIYIYVYVFIKWCSVHQFILMKKTGL